MRQAFLALVLWLGSAPAWADFTLEVAEQEFAVHHYPAEGDQLLLWVASRLHGNERIQASAEGLAALGVEVWGVDLLEDLFLTPEVGNQRALDGRYVAGLIAAAHARTGKRITVLARGYDTIGLLRGVREWQRRQEQAGETEAYLNGAILFSPELYAGIPALGLDPIYESITAASNVPILIFQAAKHGNRGQLPKLLGELRQGGAPVFVALQAGVTGLYYPGDKAPQTLATLKTMPAAIRRALALLERIPTPLHGAALGETARPEGPGLDTALKPFKGEPLPPALDLPGATGGRLQRSDYRGRVTVVNFWATWCPPCVEEIPSLNRLRAQMADEPFELISVNYAEEEADIRAFLQQVQVDFPVLLDGGGQVAQQWKVLIFPSTFVIGPDGRIVYGVNGAIHWDSPELIARLKALLR